MSDELQKQEFLAALQTLNETAGAWLDGDRDDPSVIRKTALRVWEKAEMLAVPFEGDRNCGNCALNKSAGGPCALGIDEAESCSDWGLVEGSWL